MSRRPRRQTEGKKGGGGGGGWGRGGGWGEKEGGGGGGGGGSRGGRGVGAGLPVERRMKLQALAERIAFSKLKGEMLTGAYVKKDEVERRDLEKVAAVRHELSNIRLLALKITPAVEGKDLVEREKILEEW